MQKVKNILTNSDIFIVLFILTAWVNMLQLNVIGISSNILLKPLMIYLAMREIYYFISYCELNNKNKWIEKIKSVFCYFLQIFGFKLFDCEKKMNKFSRFIFKSVRILYFVFFLSTILYFAKNKIIHVQVAYKIILFFFIMTGIYRYSKKTEKVKINSEINKAIMTIICISALTGLVQLCMLFTNFQLVLDSSAIGIYGKGLIGIMRNQNNVGISSGIAVIASITYFFFYHKRTFKIISFINLLMHIVLAIFSNSRTTYLALFLTILLMTLFAIFLFRQQKKVFIILLTILMVLMTINKYVKPYVQSHYLKNHITMNEKLNNLDLGEFFRTIDLDEYHKMVEELEKAENKNRDKNTIKPKHKIFGENYPVSPKKVYLNNIMLIELDNFMTGRLQLWKEAVLIFGSSMVHGYGFYRLNEVFAENVSYFGNAIKMGAGSSHNLIFDLLWVGGSVGFLIGMTILSASFFRLFKRIYLNIKNRKKLSGERVVQLQIFFLTMVGLFIGFTQMFEVTAITTFNISTILFWFFVRWNALLPVNKIDAQE